MNTENNIISFRVKTPKKKDEIIKLAAKSNVDIAEYLRMLTDNAIKNKTTFTIKVS